MSLIRTSTRVIAAVVVCGVAAGLPAGAAGAHPQTGRAQATADPDLQTIDLTPGLARAQVRATHDTRPFSLLGATWANPRAALAGTIQVRARAAADGRWGAWQALESDGPSEPGGRGSTDPLWVGASNGVEARVASTGGPLPAGLRLDLINPGRDRPQSRVADVAAARPIPGMVSRARWGADDSIVKLAPEYTTDVQVLFVHHTATGNGYSCSQSASIIRGIELYHVRSKGWNDIGYNFLVDKCGTLFEGRKGGVDKPVLGAHTLGFNSHSAAIAVIGDYSADGVSSKVRTVIALVAAYKIGAYGNVPSGTVVLTSNGSDRYPIGTRVALHRISGHRDTGRTECPGDALYAQLPAIRVLAGQAPKGLRVLRMTGALLVGSEYHTRGVVSPVWTLRTPSAAIDHFDVLVDGVLRQTVTGASRSAGLRLTPGRHAVTVRAFHLDGLTAKAIVQVVVTPRP